LSNCLKTEINNNKNTKGVNNMKNLFVIMVAGIFALSVLSVFGQGYGYGNDYGDRDGKRYRDKDRIHEKLNLTDEQETKIEGIRIYHQKEMIEFRAELEKKELELQELKNKGEYTREEYISKIKELNEIRNKIHLARANHQMDVYELLDPTQKVTWNDFKKRFSGHKGNFRQHRNKSRFE
jgi:Spy/CpxP family protein refolding chaperone